MPPAPDAGHQQGGDHAQRARILLQDPRQLHGRQQLPADKIRGAGAHRAVSRSDGAEEISGGALHRRAERPIEGREHRAARSGALGHDDGKPRRAGEFQGDLVLQLHSGAGVLLPRAASGAELRQSLFPRPRGGGRVLRGALPRRGRVRVQRRAVRAARERILRPHGRGGGRPDG